MPFFNIVAATNENTVVTEYEPVKSRSDSYQSEAELEKEFIRLLCEQGYTYLPIHTEKNLIVNLRERLEELNNYKFSDSEWDRFFNEAIANPNDKIEDKTRKIQEDFVQVLKRDDALTKNILLIDKKNIHNNRLQVINQYVIGSEQGAKHDNRYDVTILVNGLPLVHVELKRRGVAIREAFNQINRYQRDSFGLEAVCLSMFRFLLFLTEQTQSIIQTVHVLMRLRMLLLERPKKKRQAIVLNLHHSGPTQITE